MKPTSFKVNPTKEQIDVLTEHRDSITAASSAFAKRLQEASKLSEKATGFRERHETLKATGAFDAKSVQDLSTLEGQMSAISPSVVGAESAALDALISWRREILAAGEYVDQEFLGTLIEQLKARVGQAIAPFFEVGKSGRATGGDGFAQATDCYIAMRAAFRWHQWESPHRPAEVEKVARNSAQVLGMLQNILADQPVFSFPE